MFKIRSGDVFKIFDKCIYGVQIARYITNNIVKFQISKNMKCYKKLNCYFLYQINKNSENIKNYKIK